MSKPKRKTENIVAPSIVFEGDKAPHPFVELIDSDDPPEFKAVGIFAVMNRTDGPGMHRKEYVAFLATFRGRELIKIEPEIGNLRSIAQESSKELLVNNFFAEEF